MFTNLLLADEINRAPAKVQSALLECMEEKRVTIGEETHSLEMPFMVLATENPIEQEGTYPLPEAKLDRFLHEGPGGLPEPRGGEGDTGPVRRHTDRKREEGGFSRQGTETELIDSIYIDDLLIDFTSSPSWAARGTPRGATWRVTSSSARAPGLHRPDEGVPVHRLYPGPGLRQSRRYQDRRRRAPPPDHPFPTRRRRTAGPRTTW